MSKKMFVSFTLDETGSMQSVKSQTIDGFNEYLATLKADKNANDIRFALTKFNSDKVDVVYDGVGLDKVENLTDKTYQPASLTPLYDAIGLTIKALETKLNSKKQQKVLVVIQTDGQENHSKEFDSVGIFALIDEKKKAGWTFVFLGADQDAWITGQKLGLDMGNVVSYNSAQTKGVFHRAAVATSYYSRTSGAQSSNIFSEAEDKTNNAR